MTVEADTADFLFNVLFFFFFSLLTTLVLFEGSKILLCQILWDVMAPSSGEQDVGREVPAEGFFSPIKQSF